MARMGKLLTLCLVAFMTAPTLLMAAPANAQSIPKPSVPEFSWLTILPLLATIPTVIILTRHYNVRQGDGGCKKDSANNTHHFSISENAETFKKLFIEKALT